MNYERDKLREARADRLAGSLTPEDRERAERFNSLGDERFGERYGSAWTAAMAHALGVGVRSVRRWRRGERAVPPGVLDELADTTAPNEDLDRVAEAVAGGEGRPAPASALEKIAEAERERARKAREARR